MVVMPTFFRWKVQNQSPLRWYLAVCQQPWTAQSLPATDTYDHDALVPERMDQSRHIFFSPIVSVCFMIRELIKQVFEHVPNEMCSVVG